MREISKCITFDEKERRENSNRIDFRSIAQNVKIFAIWQHLRKQNVRELTTGKDIWQRTTSQKPPLLIEITFSRVNHFIAILQRSHNFIVLQLNKSASIKCSIDIFNNLSSLVSSLVHPENSRQNGKYARRFCLIVPATVLGKKVASSDQ